MSEFTPPHTDGIPATSRLGIPAEMEAVALPPASTAQSVGDTALNATGIQTDIEGDADDWWLEDDRTPEEEAASELDDTHAQLYMAGLDLGHLAPGENYRGATAESLSAWYGGLSDERRHYIDEQRQFVSNEQATEEHVEAEINRTAPSLLEGRLPAELESRLSKEYPGYILGVNQSGTYGVAEAQDYLREEAGVDITGYNLDQRFLLFTSHDPVYAHSVMVRGYYGVNAGGKFIMAMPLKQEAITDHGEETPSMTAQLALQNGKTATDFEVTEQEGRCAVNAKYIAGFIDEDGVFHPNDNFMRSNEPQLPVSQAETSADWL